MKTKLTLLSFSVVMLLASCSKNELDNVDRKLEQQQLQDTINARTGISVLKFQRGVPTAIGIDTIYLVRYQNLLSGNMLDAEFGSSQTGFDPQSDYFKPLGQKRVFPYSW